MLEVDRRLSSIEIEAAKIEGFILSHTIVGREMGDLRRVVSWEIDLADTFDLQIPYKLQRTLVEYVCSPLYFAAKYHDDPIPDGVGFIERKKGIPDLNLNDGIYVMAEQLVTPKFPDGLINFSPYYFKRVIEFLESSRESSTNTAIVYSLAGTSAHEIRHSRQRIYTPDQLARDIRIIAKRDDGSIDWAGWEKTPSEKDARWFEEAFAVAYVSALMKRPEIKPQI